MSCVASLDGPLGILSPAVVFLKLLFQEVCALKCGWDILPEEFRLRWEKVLQSLPSLDTTFST